MRRIVASLAVLASAFSVFVASSGPSVAATVTAVPVITGLDFPAGFTLDPNNHEIWYAERLNGEIHRRDLTTSQDTLVWDVSNLITSGEQGLLGIALDPNYPTAQFIYAYASRDVGGARNQILKITLSGGIGVSSTVIMDDPGIAGNHNGGRILFGPDHFLYAVIGDHSNAANSQIVNGNTNLAGKVLRMTTTGAPAPGGAYAGSVIWATGIRNSFGFTFDPMTNRLWETDNGPECNDEINVIGKKGNYGWGSTETCAIPPTPPRNTNHDGANPQPPKLFYQGTIGITGAAFCSGCGLGLVAEGHLYAGAVNNGQIHELTLGSTRQTITTDVVAYDHPSGVLSLETRPGQPIYFSDFTTIYKLTVS